MSKARDIASAAPAPSTVSATELGYVDGVTSAIQTQLDAKTAKSTLTTTGDIYYASGANTPARLGIGSTGNVLTVASGIPSWTAPAGGGKVLQVIQDTLVGVISTTSGGSYVDTGLEVTITPSSVSSRILVMVCCNGVRKTEGYTNSAGEIRLVRGATEIMPVGGERLGFTNTTARNNIGSVSFNLVDSPATTSATTYKVQYFTNVSAAAFFINDYDGSNDVTSSIIVMEIGA
jgi:hypothetical protein